MKNFFHILSICAIALFCGCETIDEADRFVGPVEFTPKKNVLIEDFTGQRCLNCPIASEAVKSLQDLYGKEHVIAVAIHGGSMSLPNTTPVGLATPTGEEYNKHWGIDSWPKGLVDRNAANPTGGATNYTSWAAQVIQRLVEEPKVDIAVSNATYDKDSLKLNITVDLAAKEKINGHVQVWIIENNIVGYQVMPDGSNNMAYTHNHVFRTAVNGEWGEPLTLGKNDKTTVQYAVDLSGEKWVPENLAVVAFVYNEKEGVLQVVEQHVH